MKESLEGLMSAVKTMRTERRFRVISSINKVCTVPLTTEVEKMYHELLTPFAFKYFQTQLKYSSKVNVLSSSSVLTSAGVITVTDKKCECNSYQSMGLPCRHYLAMLSYNNKSQFCPDVIHKRWLLQYFQSHYKMPVNTPTRTSITTIQHRPKQALFHDDKYKKAMSLFQQMASHLAQLGTAEFEQNFSNCKQLFDLWKSKTPVFITAEDPKESPTEVQSTSGFDFDFDFDFEVQTKEVIQPSAMIPSPTKV